METSIFDTLKHTKSLENVGFSRQQAEKQVEVMGEIIFSNLVSKGEFKALEAKVDNLYKDLVITLGSLMVVLFTIMISIIGYLISLVKVIQT
jgi:hypothetical protein